MKAFSAGNASTLCRDQSTSVSSRGWVAGPVGRRKKAIGDLFDFEDWGNHC